MLNKILVLIKRIFVIQILLIIAFLVFPSIGFAGLGDVYFFESTKLLQIKNGESTTDNNKEFKFKRSTPQISDVHHGGINTTN